MRILSSTACLLLGATSASAGGHISIAPADGSAGPTASVSTQGGEVKLSATVGGRTVTIDTSVLDLPPPPLTAPDEPDETD